MTVNMEPNMTVAQTSPQQSVKTHFDQSAVAELLQTPVSDKSIDIEVLQQAFAQINNLSQNFVHSYQNLEGQVETLADKLSKEVRQKEKQLQERERVASQLQHLLAILPCGVVLLDDRGVVQECNAVAVDLLGRPLLREKWIEIIQRNFAPRFDDGHEVSLKDGRRVKIETRSLDYEPGQLVVLTDLTETRKLQDQVNQDKRLSSMGKMMASLAHQIRTPLSTAQLYSEHLANPKLDEQLRVSFSNKLMSCLQHLETQVADMLSFAKSGGIKKQTISVLTFEKRLVEHLIGLFPNLYISGIEYERPDSFCISINLDALISALSNLVENAYQAKPEATESDFKVRLVLSLNHNRVEMQVIDNGIGIASHQLEHIFDPFFTTKSQGTGLGLAVVHGVVKAMDGSIRVESEPNKGTEFTVSLPVFQNVN